MNNRPPLLQRVTSGQYSRTNPFYLAERKLLLISTIAATLIITTPTSKADQGEPDRIYSTSARDGSPIYCWDDDRDDDCDDDRHGGREQGEKQSHSHGRTHTPVAGTVVRERREVTFIPWDEHIRTTQREVIKTLKQGKDASRLKGILYALQQRKAVEDNECERARKTPTPVATTPIEPTATSLPITSIPEPSSTATRTATPTPSQTAAPTTIPNTPTQTPVDTATNTPTHTPVPATTTPTFTPTETTIPPTATPPVLPTDQPTIADTATPSATPTPTATATATATATDTMTPTATSTPLPATETPTSTSTSPPTFTETPTATPSETVTPTSTPTAIPATATPTATPTQTPTATPTLASSSWVGNVTTGAFALAIEIPPPLLGNRSTGSSLWGSLPNAGLSCRTCHGTTPGSAGPVKTIRDAQPYSYLNNANWTGMGITKPTTQQLADLTAYLNRNTP